MTDKGDYPEIAANEAPSIAPIDMKHGSHVDAADAASDADIDELLTPTKFLAIVASGPRAIVGALLKTLKRLNYERDKARGLETVIETLSKSKSKEADFTEIMKAAMNDPVKRAALIGMGRLAEQIEAQETIKSFDKIDVMRKALAKQLGISSAAHDALAEKTIERIMAEKMKRIEERSKEWPDEKLYSTGASPLGTMIGTAAAPLVEPNLSLETRPARRGTPGRRTASPTDVAKAIDQARYALENGVLKLPASPKR